MRRLLDHGSDSGGLLRWQLLGCILFFCSCWYGRGPGLLAQEPEDLRPSIFAMGEAAGFYQFRPGSWGLVSADVWNPTSKPVRLLVASTFAMDETIQYGREFWVPAKSKRKVSYPIRIPENIEESTRRMEVLSRLYDRTDGKETLIRRPDDPMWHKSSVRVFSRKNITGYYPDYVKGRTNLTTGDEQFEELMEPARDPVLETIKVVRRFMNMKEWRQIPTLDENSDMPWPLAMGSVDELVLGGNRLASEPESRESIRGWLNQGGRLWVMLGRTDVSTVKLLLGDAFPAYEIDRVNLSQYEIISHDDTLSNKSQVREAEIPVELIRLVTEGVEVTHSVNDWPVAFWLKYGKGEILFTALELRAWSRPRRELFIRPRGIPGEVLDTLPLQQLAERFFNESTPSSWGEENFQQYVGEQIGYQIVTREWVIVILSSFCGLLLLSGLWLMRAGHLERLLWIGPVAALCTAGVLSVLGKMSRESVPSSVAVAQWIAPANHSQFVPVNGLAAIYSQHKTMEKIGVQQGGVLWPSQDASEGTSRRLVWLDHGEARWENLTLPEGVRETRFQQVVALKQPLAAYGHLTDQGMSGRLQLEPFEEISDVLLVTPTGDRYTVRVTGDQRDKFEIGPTDRLKQNELFGSLVLEDEQRHRQQVLKDLLDRSKDRQVSFPDQPTILAWSKPLEIGLVLPGEHERLGSALLAVPLHLQPTPRGESFVVPSWLCSLRMGISRDGKKPPGRYSTDVQKWLEKNFDPRRIWMRVQLPAQVLPADLSEALITLDVECDQFDLELLAWQGGTLHSQQKLVNPIGTQTVTIKQSDMLVLDDQGGLVLALQAVPAKDQTAKGARAKNYSWEVKSISVEVHGKRQAR
ncbi:MAG: hypothetical protein OSB47_03205 [Pirellulaceae bacterium]|nr:hypothetical protein [Pirellulaceae bacterium]